MMEWMDYFIVTKNDLNTIQDTIASIMKQTNVNRIIIVQSLNGPEEQITMMKNLKELRVVDEVLYEDKGLAYARKLAIDFAETEYFVFIDGDVEISPSWCRIMEHYLAHLSELKVTLADYDGEDNSQLIEPAVLYAVLSRNPAHDAYIAKQDICVTEKHRMFTYDTIISKKYVEDWVPPKGLHAFEDFHMTQHILAKGGKIWKVRNPGFHNHQGSDFKAAAWNAAGARAVGVLKNKKDVIKLFFRTIGGGIKRTLEMNNDWFATYSIKCAFGYLFGYFRYKRYIKK